MKAILIRAFGPPEVMKVEEVPDPRPGPGQVVVKIHAVGVNPVETYIRSGAYARLPALPFSPGNDAAGVVEGVGDGVEHVQAGDRVFLTGTIIAGFSFLSVLRHFLPASPSRLRFFSGRQEPFLPGRASPRPIADNPPRPSRPPAGPFSPERRRG